MVIWLAICHGAECKYLASFSAKKRAGRLIESGGRRVRTKAFWFEKFPFLGFLAGGYDLDKLTGDCIAGLTTALTVIPQGIGYAPLAGLPLQVRGKLSYLAIMKLGRIGHSTETNKLLLLGVILTPDLGSFVAVG